MKVLFIHHVTEMHGSSISLFNLLDGLIKRGVEVSLVVPINWTKDQNFYKRAEEIGIKLYPVFLVQTKDDKGWSKRPWHIRTYTREWLSLIRQKRYSYKQICSVIKEVEPDIIHTNVGIIHEGYWAAKRFNIPHVFHIREYQDKDFNWCVLPTKKMFERMLRSSSYVITITDAIKKHFHLSNKNNAETIYNGIYSEKESVFEENKKPYFICASRISPEKGCEDVIIAFSRFHKSNEAYRLVFAGDGPNDYIARLQMLAESLGCGQNIDFIGFVTNVKDFMREATALIVASYNEGFGRMTAEALFQGCLVLGRNTAGTKEIIEKTGGFAFDNNDELASQMQTVAIMSKEEYFSSISIYQSKAVSLFSIENNITQVAGIYSKIVSRNKNDKA